MEADDRQLLLGDLGEQELLQRIRPWCLPGMVGDDGALVMPDPGQAVVVTTDCLVEGVHFSPRTTPPRSVGWRSAAANLSDLAAMGALPLGITVALALPPQTPWAWIEALYGGMMDCCQQFGTGIVGGDLCRSPHPSLSITALGQVPPALALRRTAQAGDAILVTGYHGASRAGLALLLHPQDLPPAPPGRAQEWIRAHQYPQPRLDWVPLLRQVQGDLALGDRPLGAMDSSDGLGDAVLQLCRAGGVGACLQGGDLPLPPGLADWVGLERALEWCLYGGEDFELVLTVPPQGVDRVQAWGAAQGKPVYRVGTIVPEPGVILQDAQGRGSSQSLSLGSGFQHFSASV